MERHGQHAERSTTKRKSAEAGGTKRCTAWAQETNWYQKEDDIDMVNINSINFNSNHSVITANIKTSSNQAVTVIQCKVDTGSDGNMLPLHIYKNIIA